MTLGSGLSVEISLDNRTHVLGIMLISRTYVLIALVSPSSRTTSDISLGGCLDGKVRRLAVEERLSERQQRILAFIERFLEEKGYPPTMRRSGPHWVSAPSHWYITISTR
jgi:hypothetical protein